MLHPHITTFVQVADCGSFSKAAAAHFCSPVSIMNQMNALEWRMGFKLLERTNHGVRLTPAGQELYASAKELMEAANEAVRRARDIAGVEQGVIRIGTSFLRPCTPLLDIWNSLEVEHPNFQIKIVPFDDSPTSFSHMLESLGKEIDCFVSPCDAYVWKRKYNLCMLAQSRCCIAISKNHHLARKKKLTWDDLAGESLMLVKKGISPVIDRMWEEIEHSHNDIKIVDIKNIYDIEVFNMCEQFGYIMETPEIWKDIHPSLITLPMKWTYTLPYGVVYPKKASPAFQSFIAIVQRHSLE